MSERRRYRDCACQQETACGLHKTTVAAADARALRSLARFMERHDRHGGKYQLDPDIRGRRVITGLYCGLCLNMRRSPNKWRLPARYRRERGK